MATGVPVSRMVSLQVTFRATLSRSAMVFTLREALWPVIVLAPDFLPEAAEV